MPLPRKSPSWIGLKSSLCDYSEACIIVEGAKTIAGEGNNAAARQADEGNKEVVFKTWAPFTKCIGEINNTQIDNAKNIDVVTPMYNSIEYGVNYSKISGSLWKYYRDEPALDNNNIIVNFPGNSKSFKSKVKITEKTVAAKKKTNVEIIVP